jgi:uncharacterized protein involved in exopolysaccharide biosynthesis
MVAGFWDVTAGQLEEKRSELRQREREAEEGEERHQLEIKARAREDLHNQCRKF